MKDLSARQLEILDAAGTILTRSGVSSMTIKNLANEMHFSESALYRHFSSKENIIIALLQYLSDDMENRFSGLENLDLSPEKLFVEIFNNQLDFCLQHPQFVVAVFSEGLMEESKKISESILQIIEIKRKHLIQIINRGQQQNVFTSDIDSYDLTNIILGTYRLLMFEWRAEGFNDSINEKGQKMIQNLLTLIKN